MTPADGQYAVPISQPDPAVLLPQPIDPDGTPADMYVPILDLVEDTEGLLADPVDSAEELSRDAAQSAGEDVPIIDDPRLREYDALLAPDVLPEIGAINDLATPVGPCAEYPGWVRLPDGSYTEDLQAQALPPRKPHPYDAVREPTIDGFEEGVSHTPLTAAETLRLTELEVGIQEHLYDFYQVGKVLLESGLEGSLHSFVFCGRLLGIVHDEHLWRGHASFRAYLKSRWSSVFNLLSRSQANRLLRAAETMADLIDGSAGEDAWLRLPANEYQCRLLSDTRLTPEQKRAAWQEASADRPDGRVTGGDVKRAVAKQIKETQLLLPMSGNGLRHAERFDDREPEAFRDVASYKPDLKRGWCYTTDVVWDPQKERLHFTAVRPGNPATHLRELPLKGLTISGKTLQSLGFRLPERSEP